MTVLQSGLLCALRLSMSICLGRQYHIGVELIKYNSAPPPSVCGFHQHCLCSAIGAIFLTFKGEQGSCIRCVNLSDFVRISKLYFVLYCLHQVFPWLCPVSLYVCCLFTMHRDQGSALTSLHNSQLLRASVAEAPKYISCLFISLFHINI